MAQNDPKLVSPLSLTVDAVLLIAFFAFMYTQLRVHVPSSDPRMITLWAAISASCLTGVLWLALQMVRMVFRAQRAARRDRPTGR